MIKGLSSLQPRQRLERAVSPVEIKPDPGTSVMTRDALSKTAEAKLDRRHAYTLMTADDLHELLRRGTLLPERTSFRLDRPSLDGDPFVLQLSEEGKRALLSSDPALADALIAGQSEHLSPKSPIKLDTHVEEILLFQRDKETLLKTYGDMVAKGEAPEVIAGQPFKTYFDQHVRGTEDLIGDIELKNFSRQIPGFASLSPTEQRVRAALGGQLAESWPETIPGDVRRQMANSMIRHKTFDRPAPGADLKVAGEIKPFFHGTSSGKLISRIGFRGQPELLFKKLPAGAQRVLRDKLGIRFTSRHGAGIYFGNAAIAGSYAFIEHKGTKPVQVVSGLVAMGKTTLKDFAEDVGADTRIVPNAEPKGDYFVTRDPRRFTVKALTTLDPKQTDGLMRYFPDILKAYSDDPYRIGQLVDRMPPAPSRRALEEALKGADRATVSNATLLLARRGDQRALTSTMKRLESITSPKDLEVIQTTLLAVLESMGPGHGERTGPIAEAMLKTGLRVMPGKTGETETLAKELVYALGDEIRPMIELHGLNVAKHAPAEGALDRAMKAVAKGFKRLL